MPVSTTRTSTPDAAPGSRKVAMSAKPEALDATTPATQDVRLTIDGKLIGRCRWHTSGGAAGAVQLLEFAIDEPFQRQGYGGQLLARVVREADKAFTDAGFSLRRVWVVLGQKSDLMGRAFFTRHGYHHSATIPNIAPDEDLLVYHVAYE